MPSCAVPGCNSHNKMKQKTNIKFYSFPKNKSLQIQWIQACSRQGKLNVRYAAICSKHFESKYFFTPLKYRLLNVTLPKSFRNLEDNAVPTLALPKCNSVKSEISTSCNATERMQDDFKIPPGHFVEISPLNSISYGSIKVEDQEMTEEIIEPLVSDIFYIAFLYALQLPLVSLSEVLSSVELGS
ncbi:hypothetical protein HUJ04_001352 [Dendroctonus ponderosae]|nr:hypothetical protein HUJ04_001352 [Dendroctonus ponderosae]